MTKETEAASQSPRMAKSNKSRFDKSNSLLTTLYSVLVMVVVCVWIRVSIPATVTVPSSNLYRFMGAAFVAIGLAAWFFKGRLLLGATALCLLAALTIAVTRAGAGLALLVACWLFAIAWAFGSRILGVLSSDAVICPLERLVLGTAIGVGTISLFVFAIAAVGLLYRSILFATLGVMTLLLLGTRWRKRTQSVKRLRESAEGIFASGAIDLRLIALITAFAGVSFCLGLIWAVAPETTSDALNYQLGVPQVYVKEHGLVEVPYTFWSYLLGSNGMLYALALSLTGQPLPQLIHLTFGLLLTLLTFLLGRRSANPHVGLIAAGLVSILPIVTSLSGIAGVDLIVAVYAFGAVYAGSVWMRQREDGWLTIAGLMTGFGLAAKLNVMAAAIPLTIIVVCRLVVLSGTYKDRLGLFLRFAVPAALIPLPLFVTRTVWTGNPVFPFLNNVFRSPYWSAVNETFNFETYGSGTDLFSFLMLPWNLTAHADRFNEGPGGVLGALPLLALPGFALLANEQRRRFIWPAVVVLLGGVFIWFKSAQIVRFLVMFLPAMAVLAAFTLEALYERISKRGPLRRGAQVLALWIGIVLLAASTIASVRLRGNIPERIPYRFFLGLETPGQYLSRVLPVYSALSMLNRESPDSKVLSLGNESRVYTTARIEGSTGSRQANQSLNILNISDLHQFLTANGYDYVLLNRNENVTKLNARTMPVLREDFLSSGLMPIFSSRNVFLYRVEPLGNSVTALVNLIRNCSFEQTSYDNIPSEWLAYGSPVIDQSGTQSRTGVTAVRADNSSGLFTRFSTGPGEVCTLGHWSRSERPGQFARLQINWLANDFSLVESSIEVHPAALDWTWHQFSQTAPERAAYAQVYVTVHGDSEVWFDDYAFVRENVPSLERCCITGRGEKTQR